MDQIAEWKEQWNNGDVKFVPDLFELVAELLIANEQLQTLIKQNSERHLHHMTQLEAQNRALTEQLTKIELSRSIQVIIPKEDVTQDFLEELKMQMAQGLCVPAEFMGVEKHGQQEEPKKGIATDQRPILFKQRKETT